MALSGTDTQEHMCAPAQTWYISATRHSLSTKSTRVSREALLNRSKIES